MAPKEEAKCGSLTVQTGFFGGWSRKWFVIEDRTLVQYNDSSLKKIQTKFNLVDATNVQAVSIKEKPNKAYCFRFDITSGSKKKAGKPCYFVALNEGDQASWIQALLNASNKNQLKEHEKVFEVDLLNLQKNAVAFDPERKLPVLVVKCVEFLLKGDRLSEEGIFRLGGNFDRIQELRLQFDSGQNPDFSETEDPNVVASLLKMFFRSLPHPLLMAENYDVLLDCCRDHESELPAKLKAVISSLPVENEALLCYLCKFLAQVDKYSERSKMDSKNLATVFGPNLLRSAHDDPLKLMAESDFITRIAYCILEHFDLLFSSSSSSNVQTPKAIPPSPAAAPISPPNIVPAQEPAQPEGPAPVELSLTQSEEPVQHQEPKKPQEPLQPQESAAVVTIEPSLAQPDEEPVSTVVTSEQSLEKTLEDESK